MTVTQHRAAVWLTSDLSVEFTVFDHNSSEVPDAAWNTFVEWYRHTHGATPANNIREYVTEHSIWQWDKIYSDGTIVIGEPGGPLTLDDGPAGPEGHRIVFWNNGDPYDTGLRVLEEEAAIISRLLHEKAKEQPK